MSRLTPIIVAFLFVIFGTASVTAADVKLGNGTMLSDKPFYIITYVEVDPSRRPRKPKH